MKKTLFKTKLLFIYAILAIFGFASIAQAATTVTPPGGVTMDAEHFTRNLTTGQVNYTVNTNAVAGQTVRVMVWYHNTEDANSGKNATNLNVKVALPTAYGTDHVSTATVGGSNTNQVTQVTNVISPTRTRLEFIPGSVKRVYNTGTNAAPTWTTASISDAVVSGGYLVTSMKPCWNFQESISFDVRIVAEPVATPTCTLTATPNNVESGSNVTLNYSSTNATSGTLNNNIGNVGVSGSRTVNPTANTTYTYTVTGNGETATCNAAVTVYTTPTPPPPTPTPTPTPTVITGKGSLPTSGPVESVMGTLGGISLAGAAGYYRKTKGSLLKAFKKF